MSNAYYFGHAKSFHDETMDGVIYNWCDFGLLEKSLGSTVAQFPRKEP